MIRATTRSDLRDAIASFGPTRTRTGLVPTMGYLHEGHLSLIDLVRESCDVTVVSIFVNPLQFGPGEDLDRYPRDLERDATLAAGRGTDVLFVPAREVMYPAGEVEVFVDAPRLADRLCGAFRPGHFRGVLTVVAKLLNLARPDVAAFGQKDYQQLALIRRMVRDLDVPVEILAGPIIREPDGLAMSSRNVYLDGDERRDARVLNRALTDAQAAYAAGTRDAADLVRIVRERLDTAERVSTQYVELVGPEDLEPVATAFDGAVLAIAVHVGATRLIDNRTLREAE